MVVDRQQIVGVLMLDTAFTRYPGDIGHPDSIDGPCLYRRVPSATVTSIVTDAPLPDAVVSRFIDAGRQLVADGATVVVTSCGFLHAVQAQLDDALDVPVISSSLVMLPELVAAAEDQSPVGVLTFDATALTPRHLGAVSPSAVVIEGLDPGGYFRRVIEGDIVAADRERLQIDACAAADRLLRCSPAAVVLECTNLSPYKSVLQRVFGDVPVVDLHDAIARCERA